MKFVATCLFGIESLLGKEIDDLGYKRINTIDGRVIFEGDMDAFIKANLYLRTAERVLYLVDEFDAVTFDELFEQTKKIKWSEIIKEKDCFPVKGHSIKSELSSIPSCQKIIKKAIAESLSNDYKLSWFEESQINYQIEFFILKNHVYLMIDTSGDSLHKRGYRPVSTTAPIRETLACALVMISRPREDVLFWDPMCGSGTIAIEAALLMTNTAPGLYRNFAFEKFSFIDKNKIALEREQALENINSDTQFEVFASDISQESVDITTTCVKNAKMEKIIRVFKEDALKIQTNGRRGTIVCNPPYGERLVSLKEAQSLYRKMGEHFSTLDNWQIYIITNNEEFEKYYGLKADKKRKLYNGMIPCTYYEYFKRRIK